MASLYSMMNYEKWFMKTFHKKQQEKALDV